MHNEVTINRDQSSGKGYYRKHSRMASTSSLWPPKEDCPTCWQSLTDDTGQAMNMDSYDQKELYNHLKKTYWPSGVHNNRLIVLDRWSKTKRSLAIKRLRARMAAHSWSFSVLFFHALAVCIMLRILFPRWSMRTMRRMCLYKGHQRQHHVRRHRNTEHTKRRHVDEMHRDSDQHFSHSRNHSYHPVRHKSSPPSRPSQSSGRSNNHRSVGSHHHPTRASYVTHHRRHEGRRRHSGSGRTDKQHQFNHFLEL